MSAVKSLKCHAIWLSALNLPHKLINLLVSFHTRVMTSNNFKSRKSKSLFFVDFPVELFSSFKSCHWDNPIALKWVHMPKAITSTNSLSVVAITIIFNFKPTNSSLSSASLVTSTYTHTAPSNNWSINSVKWP